MSKIVLGVTADGKPFAIDLVLLLETRLLLSANSGGGKSYTLRQLIEQIFGKVQIILVDREGEFKSLRDKYDFLLVGEGGDIPAHIGSARLLAEKLLKSGVSAICDLYETFRTRPIDRLAWVREFLMGLVDAPKSLWHDVVVIIDEAHLFAPEVAPKGRNMEERDIINGCKEAVIALCTVGRKRGQTAVLATQRLAKLDKDASAELLNRMIGMTMEGQDVDRAIDLMSIPRDERASFRKSIRELEPGNLYVVGRAISRERILVKISQVQTKHHDPRSRKHVDYSPPTPAKIRALLSEFEDLPKEIEAKAKTEKDLRAEVELLKRKLKAVTNQTAIVSLPAKTVVETKIETKIEIKEVPVLQASEIKAMDKILSRMGRLMKGLEPLTDLERDLEAWLSQTGVRFQEAKTAAENIRKPLPVVKPAAVLTVGRPITPYRIQAASLPVVVKAIEKDSSGAPDDCELSDLQLRQLTGLLDFTRIGVPRVDRKWLAGWLGMSLSGHFKNNFYGLQKRGLIAYDQMMLYLTEEGFQSAPASELKISVETILDRCVSAVEDLSGRQLRYLHSIYPELIAREDLAAALGMSLSGHFKNCFYDLHKAGMIDYGTAENKMKLKCADWLFLGQLLPA